jgi:hypothetical protein
VTWQTEVFGPMRERTLENAQVYLLATRYDLSRDSRLAREIARTANRALDAEECRQGVERVRTGELLLSTTRGPLLLPIRTEEDLDRVIAGERWVQVRRDLLARCEARYRALFPEALPHEVRRFLRTLWPEAAPRQRGRRSPAWGPRRERPWTPGRGGDVRPLLELDQQRGRYRLERGVPRPGHAPETLRRLSHYLATQAGIPPAVQETLLLELVALRARFYPRVGTLKSGQMPLAAMHVQAGRSLWAATRHQPLAPVVVSVLAGRERLTLQETPPRIYDELLSFHSHRLARALTEAYAQDGLLSFAELQWIFLLSTGTVSRAIDSYQRTHRVLLPCPGTVLDMGRMLTHKDVIVRLHLEGRTVLEIARQTYHDSRSVDAYLKSFDAVLILHLYALPSPLMATVLGRGQSLVEEYLDLIDHYLQEPDTMRAYLRSKGIPLAPLVSHGG